MNYLTTVLIIILICLGTCDKAEADTAHINYVTSTNDNMITLTTSGDNADIDISQTD